MALHLSREEFRQWADGQKQRYERIAGEPVAMSPERIGHVRITSCVWAAPGSGGSATPACQCEALP